MVLNRLLQFMRSQTEHHDFSRGSLFDEAGVPLFSGHVLK